MSSSDFDFSRYRSSSPLGESSSGELGTSEPVSAASLEEGSWSDPSAFGSAQVAGPPFLWVGIAIGLATAGVVLGLLAGQVLALAVAAWALSGPLAIGASAVFTFVDTKQRANSIYGQRKLATWLYATTLALALVGVVVASLRIAGWAGRA